MNKRPLAGPFSLTLNKIGYSVYDDCAEQNIQPEDVWKPAHTTKLLFACSGRIGEDCCEGCGDNDSD